MNRTECGKSEVGKRGNMRGPSLFACLPGLTTNCLLQTLLKNSNALGIAAEQQLLPPPPPSEEVFPSEVCHRILIAS